MTEWLNATGAAKYLGISLSTLYSLAQRKRIPAMKVGKKWRFSRSDLETWIRANKPINEFFLSAEADIEENLFLRDPQILGYKATRDFFTVSSQKAILNLPVGCGKTGLIAILPFGISAGRILVIAPNLTIRDELTKSLDVSGRGCFLRKCQVLPSASLSVGPHVAVLDGKDANIHDCDNSHITVTNIQQLASSADRWLPQFSDNYFDMILVDEGHHNAAPSWKKVFKRFPNAKVVSLTATPFRSDEKAVEGELIYRYSFKNAMLRGYIKKLQAVYVTPEEIYFTYKGDDRHHTLNEVLELKEEDWFSKGVALSPICNKSIVNASLERLERLRESGTIHQLIAVACSVRHAKSIRSLYEERGYRAAEIHSNLSEEEKLAILHKLRAGMLDCIVQVQMLGEGFDHPKLSVAAIFRPFRSLPPYIQFVGRIMRVIVQNDARHPDNRGYIVTHAGMNLDQLLGDFRDIEREDQDFLQGLLEGIEQDETPKEILDGNSRLKLHQNMLVNNEIVVDLFEEDFLSTEDASLLEEARAQLESLGIDSEEIVDILKNKMTKGARRVQAPPDAAINPQKQRREARRRLNEEIKSVAKILLNNLNLQFGGHELAFKYGLGITGTNFVVAVQLFNREIDKILGVGPGKRSQLKYDDFQAGLESLSTVLEKLVRRLKKKLSEEV